MKKVSIILLLLVAISTLFIVGCSDDDEKTIVAAVTAQGWIIGQASVSPEIDFNASIFPITNNTFVIDSVIAGDSLCRNDNGDYWYIYGDGNYGYIEYENEADSQRYSSGDMYDITFYKDNSSTTTSMKLLNRQDDEPNFILPVDDDSISLGESLNIIWHTVPNADWYGMRIQYWKDSAGTYLFRRKYLSFTDTSYVIPASTNIYNGYYRIYIVAATGPGSGEEPNINGLGLMGEIHSESYSNQIRIYVGNGIANPVGDFNDDDNVDLKTIGKEIIKQIRNQPDVIKADKQ